MNLRPFAAMCLVITILGSGCARTDSRTIRLSSWGDEKENAILSGLIADFEKSHPDIPVKLLRVPYTEYMPKLFSQIAAGNAPDVIFVSSDDVMTLSVKGTLEPLDDYVKSASGFPIKDFYPYALQDYTVNGNLYVMPRDIDPHYDIYYNKKAFDEAHLSYPKDDWTMDQFLTDAKALVKKYANGKVTRCGVTDDVGRIEPGDLSR